MASPAELRTNVRLRLGERSRMHLGLLVVQFGYAGYAILTRVALSSGLSRFIFPIYRNGLAVLLLAPVAWSLERGRRPPLTLYLLTRLFLLGLLGIFGNQVLYLAGLQFTSPTITSLMQNLVPVFAFVLSAVFRLEDVQWRRQDGMAKVLGTVLCVVGATVVGVYQGPVVLGSAAPLEPPLLVVEHKLGLGLELRLDAWHVGVLCLVGNTLAWAAYLNLQVPVLAAFPAPTSLAAFVSLFGTLQLILLALVLVPQPSAWLLNWGTEVLSVIYAGLVASGLNLAVQTWCVQRGGPLLVAVYEPLQCVVVAMLALVFLGDRLYLGTVLGGILIVLGLYSVTWGQVETQRLVTLEGKPTSNRKPLLQA